MWLISKSFYAVILIFFITTTAAQPPCYDSLPASLLTNNSFEQHSICKTDDNNSEHGVIDAPLYYGGVTVPGWHPFAKNREINYFNYDCIIDSLYSVFDTSFFSSNGYVFLSVPLPVPDGKGFIAIGQYNTSSVESKSIKDYITSCLASPLKAGTSYVFSFDFAFGKTRSDYGSPEGSISPFRVGIFGRKDCPTYPIANDNPDSAEGCLSNRSGWVQLGTVQLFGQNEWVKGVIVFTPSFDVNCIGVGPDCSLNGNIGDTDVHYFMDNFILNTTAGFEYKLINTLSGNPCTGGYVLQAPSYNNASYQWYKDGSKLSGAILDVYKVPDSIDAEGSYTVHIDLQNGKCLNSLPYSVTFSKLWQFSLGNDTMLCTPATLKLNALRSYISTHVWQDGSQDYYQDISKSGNYWVELSDEFGCVKRDSINVVIQKCDSCSFYIPGAFTPNNDGLNDLFKVKPQCTNIPLQNFAMKIFNRFGQPVFETRDINNGWNGVYKNFPLATGVYIYVINYSYNNKRMIRKGTIVLLR